MSKLNNYIILEKDFKTGQKSHDKPPEQVKKAAGQELTAEEMSQKKKELRKKEILSYLKAERLEPVNLVVRVRLNLPEEIVEEKKKEEEPI